MLRDRWVKLCNRIERDGVRQWLEIESCHGEPHRAYHNLDHIEDCLERFDEFSYLAEDPVAVEMAIWFHDLIYDPKASDNEARSVAVAEAFLGGTSIAKRVSGLIMATKHDSCPASIDAMLLCDIDLSILGREPSRYRAYADAIRREYDWISIEDYAVGRIWILKTFLDRPSIYTIDEFQERYERRARVNLRAEIDRLKID